MDILGGFYIFLIAAYKFIHCPCHKITWMSIVFISKGRSERTTTTVFFFCCCFFKSWNIVRQKKNICVFQVSALKKLGMVSRHYHFIKIIDIETAFFTTFPPFLAYLTVFCFQFAIKCLGSGNLKHTYFFFGLKTQQWSVRAPSCLWYSISKDCRAQFSPFTPLPGATSWKNLFLPYANNKGADWPAHPCCLISVFVVRCLNGTIQYMYMYLYLLNPKCQDWLASAAEEASLSLTWSKTPKTGFLVTRLPWSTSGTHSLLGGLWVFQSLRLELTNFYTAVKHSNYSTMALFAYKRSGMHRKSNEDHSFVQLLGSKLC